MFRCPAPPLLGADETAYEDLESLALRLRAAFDDCRDDNARLIDLVTKPRATAPK